MQCSSSPERSDESMVLLGSISDHSSLLDKGRLRDVFRFFFVWCSGPGCGAEPCEGAVCELNASFYTNVRVRCCDLAAAAWSFPALGADV